jgi:hypothetical protein
MILLVLLMEVPSFFEWSRAGRRRALRNRSDPGRRLTAAMARGVIVMAGRQRVNNWIAGDHRGKSTSTPR